MSLKVFWGSGSQPAWTVLLALEAKGLSYESKLIEFSKKEHKTDEFLAMNPRGKVPLVVDGAYPIYESEAILHYLEKKYPDKTIFGEKPEDVGNVCRVISEIKSYLHPDLMKVVRGIFFNRQQEQGEQMKESWQVVQDELKTIDHQLGAGQYLCTDQPSAADFVVLPLLQALKRALNKDNARELDFPDESYFDSIGNIKTWMTKMEALPYFDKTYPPHWR